MLKRVFVQMLVLSMVFTSILYSPETVKAAGIQATYYVSTQGDDSFQGTIDNPFATITKARDVIRTINSNMTGDIYVFIRGGKYQLEDKILLDTRDSGTNGYNIIYKAYQDETPVFTSEKRITGWTIYDSIKNIYKAYVGSTPFSQLYIDKKMAVLARTPNLLDEGTGGPYNKVLNDPYPKYPFKIAASEIGTWANDNRVLFNWIIHWNHNKANVSGYTVDGDIATVNFVSPEDKYWLTNSPSQSNTYYFWENSLSFLDAAGEWYWDSNDGYLYYIPRSGENMATSEIVIPTLENLFEIAGSDENLALNKTVTASSYVAGQPPESAVDGNGTGTQWYCTTAGDKWLKIDLGQSYSMDRWAVKHAQQTGVDGKYNTQDFKIQSSVDENTWNDISVISGNYDGTSGASVNFTARYVRLYITKGTQDNGDSAARISEFELHRTSLAHNIQIIGLNFNFSNWTTPRVRGYLSGQAGVFIQTAGDETGVQFQGGEGWEAVPGILQLKYTKNINVERNTFSFSGGCGIKSFYDSFGNTFKGNVVDTCAGGGIYIGAGNYWFDSRMIGASKYDTISNNYIANCGLDYKDSVGIWSSFPQHMSIENNEITNIPYTGITMGWTWSDKDLYGPTDNNIRYNKIHNVMRALDDGGGIYNLGRMPNTNISYNYIFNLPVSPYQGNANYGRPNVALYLDNGSCYKTVEYNVVNNAASAFYAINSPIHDNVFRNNYHNVQSNVVNTDTNSFTGNIAVNEQNWPTEALDIMNSAGITSTYMDIIPSTNSNSIGTRFDPSFYNSLENCYISVGDIITSPSKNCWATLKADGNFMVYNGAPGTTNQGILWDTNTAGVNDGNYFINLQADGSLNFYRGKMWNNQGFIRKIRLSSETPTKGWFLSLQDDKNLAIYRGATPDFNAGMLWSRSSMKEGVWIREGQYLNNQARNAFFIMQSNGDLALYSGSSPSDNQGLIWHSNTQGAVGNYFAYMQTDGNLCIYKGTGPSDNKGFVWSSNTSKPVGSFTLQISDDKKANIIDQNGNSVVIAQ